MYAQQLIAHRCFFDFVFFVLHAENLLSPYVNEVIHISAKARDIPYPMHGPYSNAHLLHCTKVRELRNCSGPSSSSIETI